MSNKKPKLDVNKGMGKERRVEDYYRYIGFDPEKDKISTRDFCQNLLSLPHGLEP